jgi:hypothetical protein
MELLWAMFFGMREKIVCLCLFDETISERAQEQSIVLAFAEAVHLKPRSLAPDLEAARLVYFEWLNRALVLSCTSEFRVQNERGS